MIALLLSISMIWAPSPDGVRATWYGRTDGKSCYGGYVNTCAPYRKGETVMYAAVPGFRWKDKPYKAFVCYKDKCVWVTIRDCLCSRKGGGYIDLSPAAFMALAPLSRGALYGVHVYIDRGESPSLQRTVRPIRHKY
jgi:hypothetical protein